jgi:carbonic anhydrase/acetyltransferase-like protein (isoleucine patch superfamily)
LGEQTLVAAAALVRENEHFPARSLLAGVPAGVKGPVSEAHLTLMSLGIEHYSEIMQHYQNGI